MKETLQLNFSTFIPVRERRRRPLGSERLGRLVGGTQKGPELKLLRDEKAGFCVFQVEEEYDFQLGVQVLRPLKVCTIA